MTPTKPATHNSKPKALSSKLTALSSKITLLLTLPLLSACAPPRGTAIIIGAKNFTEQVVLGELLAQQIEATFAAEGHPQRVQRRFYLAGSYLCQQALVNARIDGYVEYSGTALTAILKQPLPPTHDAHAVFATVARLYAERYNVIAEPGLGFEDTFALVLRADDADRLHLRTISDAAAHSSGLRLGVGYEFQARPDGLPGLEAAYNLHFAPPRVMDLGLLYRALSAHQIDLAAGNSTDGPIRALGLRTLVDDRHYFPPYEAIPLFRADSLALHPEIALATARLAGQVTAAEMQSMNDAVDGRHQDVAEVVHQFRLTKGL
jgi:osmoprotectant transport system substrate-binding protein